MSDIALAVLRKTLLQRARLALITHLFTFLSLLCLDSASSATSVILSALKVATSIYEHGVKAQRTERGSHHD